ncbi:MAG: hypothetical protein FJ010_09845 [Chloroflexi bacterium]|nr:hypothetical protein [Chloroflexota bacterium]
MPNRTTDSSPSLARKILSSPLMLSCLLLTLAVWIIFFFQIPLFQNLSYWFWPLTKLESPQIWWILPILFLDFSVLALVGKFPDKVFRNLVLLILVGYITQQMFAFVEGRGLDGVRDRVVNTGHADFAYDAANPPSISRVIRDYRSMIEKGELHRYPHSTKPPGHFLVYILASRLAELLPWSTPDPFERLATFAALLFPLLTYLPLIPLYLLARLYLSRQHAYLAAFLFMSAPNLNLMTLHLDQCLYPFLFILPITLFLYGKSHSQTLLFVFSGISIAGALFVSFSLVPIAAVIGLLALLSFWTNGQPFHQKAWREIINLILAGAGFLVVELILYGFFRYNLIEDYLYVMSRHQAWKVGAWTPRLSLSIGALDILEYAVWMGIPLFLFAVSWMFKAARGWRGDGEHLLAFSILISFLVMAFLGRTVAETGRLWIFLLPCFALFAAFDLRKRYPLANGRIFPMIFGLQLISTFIIKLYQDFY